MNKDNKEYNLRLAFKLLKQMNFKTDKNDRYRWNIQESKSRLRSLIKDSTYYGVKNVGLLRYETGPQDCYRTYKAIEYHPDSFLQFLRTGNTDLLKSKAFYIYFNKQYYNINEFFLFENNIYNRNDYYLEDGKLYPLKNSITISTYSDRSKELVCCKDDCIDYDEVKTDINCQDKEQYIQINPRFNYWVTANYNSIFPFIKYKDKRIVVKNNRVHCYNYLRIPLRSAKDFKIDMDFPGLKRALKDRGCREITDMYFSWNTSRSFGSSVLGKIFKKANNNYSGRSFNILILSKTLDFLSKMNNL